MPVFPIIILLSLNMGNSGGAMPPRVTLKPNFGNILRGDSVTLTCIVDSANGNQTYEWYKNQQQIPGQYQQSLRMRNPREDNSGAFQCRSVSQNVSDPVALTVTPNAVILQSPPPPIYEGDPVILRCHHRKDYDGRNARFYNNGADIPSSDSVLHIFAARKNAGKYTCRKEIRVPPAPDYSDYASETVVLSVKELFCRPQIRVTSERIIEGEEMTVKCDTRLDPLRHDTRLQYAFYRDGYTVQEFTLSDTYRVLTTRKQDSGDYSCVVRTVSGTPIWKRSDVSHYQILPGGAMPPRVTLNPNYENILIGDSATLTCIVDSAYGNPTYQWYKNQQQIPGQNQRTLKILDSIEEDSGAYRCRSGSQDLSDPVNLTVTYKAVILQSPPPPIYEGDLLTLRCHHRKDHDGGNARFYKDGAEIPSSGSGLQIPAADTDTRGTYTCRKEVRVPTAIDYRNYATEAEFISVRELFTKPKIRVTPERITEGGVMTVTCDTKLDPLRPDTQLQIAFYIDGHPVREFNLSDTYRILTWKYDSGDYSCEVRTVSRTVWKRSDVFRIQVLPANNPYPIHQPSGSTTTTPINGIFSHLEMKVTPDRIIIGREMTVTCDTRLDPLRNNTELCFAFYRNGLPVRGFNVSDTYHVPSTKMEDSGNYTCEVRTASGAVRKSSTSWVEIKDYSRMNLIRFVLSGIVLIIAFAFIYCHNK